MNLQQCLSEIDYILPRESATKLLTNETDELYLMFMGDTQYHFPCTLSNDPCKEASQEFRTKKRLKQNLEEQCAILEGNFANEVQRKALFDLYRRMPNKPKALILNGDLTNFGHKYQLDLFKTEWLTMPFPIIAGLGNHDYENNVNDCVANQCANNMLSWFLNEYAPLMQLQLDVETSGDLWKSTHDGSLAYYKDFCSDSGANCVHSIQLHNKPDYAANINSVQNWKIRSSLQWLRTDLDKMRNRTWPVLINLHNYEPIGSRLKRELAAWLASDENSSIVRRAMVLFAHYHEKHSLSVECISGTTVPFLFVGSVPKNRYTVIKFRDNQAQIFLMQANQDGSNTIVSIKDFVWKPC
ncbi:hypothetical protein M3Y97_00937500 [Aphelenchoides bicaudatus]|nr:hypothetical protein M3Y97_00937500 [Aphelenchoides bicaudatus]